MIVLPTCVQGKRLVFVTNNSTKSRQGYTKKFQELGLNVTAVRDRRTHQSHFRRVTSADQPGERCSRAGGDLFLVIRRSSLL